MERLFHSVTETAAMLHIGRTNVYRLIAEKRLQAVKLGAKTLIPDESIRRLAAELLSERAA